MRVVRLELSKYENEVPRSPGSTGLDALAHAFDATCSNMIERIER